MFYHCGYDMTCNFHDILSITLFLKYNLCLRLCNARCSHLYKSMMIFYPVFANCLSKVVTISRNHLRISLSSQGTLSHRNKVTFPSLWWLSKAKLIVSPPSPTKGTSSSHPSQFSLSLGDTTSLNIQYPDSNDDNNNYNYEVMDILMIKYSWKKCF